MPGQNPQPQFVCKDNTTPTRLTVCVASFDCGYHHQLCQRSTYLPVCKAACRLGFCMRLKPETLTRHMVVQYMHMVVGLYSSFSFSS